jgi:hypothetical protein
MEMELGGGVLPVKYYKKSNLEFRFKTKNQDSCLP